MATRSAVSRCRGRLEATSRRWRIDSKPLVAAAVDSKPLIAADSKPLVGAPRLPPSSPPTRSYSSSARAHRLTVASIRRLGWAPVGGWDPPPPAGAPLLTDRTILFLIAGTIIKTATRPEMTLREREKESTHWHVFPKTELLANFLQKQKKK